MKIRYLVLLLSSIIILLNGCILSISKPIIEEIIFCNATDGKAWITDSGGNIVLICEGKSSSYDISKISEVKIFYPKSKYLCEYDLSGLNSKVSPDKKLSGTCLWGHIHWIYKCTIAKDKSLEFRINESQVYKITPIKSSYKEIPPEGMTEK